MSATRVAGTVGEALRAAIARLRASPTQTPRLDAELLVAHVIGADRAWVLAHPDAELSLDATDALEAAVARRAGEEPIAYIRGYKEWRSLRIRTDRRALIPRPETELLADEALAELGRRVASTDGIVVAWDVGTGSGAVAVALGTGARPAIAAGRLRLLASDVSADALALAAENLAAHGLYGTVTLVRADLLEPVATSLPAPDVVVANLPYLTTAEVDAGVGSLRHEPPEALDGGPDGMAVLGRLLDGIARHVAPGATILLEVGAGQVSAVRTLAPAGASVEPLVDLAGVERIVRIGLRPVAP